MATHSFMTATWVVETMAAANALLEKDRLVTNAAEGRAGVIKVARCGPGLASARADTMGDGCGAG
jgi:hypothetical protein